VKNEVTVTVHSQKRAEIEPVAVAGIVESGANIDKELTKHSTPCMMEYFYAATNCSIGSNSADGRHASLSLLNSGKFFGIRAFKAVMMLFMMMMASLFMLIA
jgi:hypothetical protein